MNLVIDVGNSRVKVALFEKDSIQEVVVVEKENLIEKLSRLITKYPVEKGILSSVVMLNNQFLEQIKKLTPIFILSHTAKLPFFNRYATPITLGLDRIALVSAAVSNFPKKNTLIIDAGTCITYDFVNQQKEYLGGAISPGIVMRYKSLHAFTSKLPNLIATNPNHYIGNSTEQSIHSGVINGIIREINGTIEQYKQEYEDLTVVLTGGDINFLCKQLKNSIFANQNFLLIGLNTILNFNN